MTFVLGGFTGIILATPPLDYMVHNTLFLVAHFHNMLIPGLLYGMIAGYMYWFPKAFGFRLNEQWGRIAFVCWVVGFYLAFMPLYVLGAPGWRGARRRCSTRHFGPGCYRAGRRFRCSLRGSPACSSSSMSASATATRTGCPSATLGRPRPGMVDVCAAAGIEFRDDPSCQPPGRLLLAQEKQGRL